MLALPALTVFPADCIQSIAVAWRTVRETERGRERGWCTTTRLTASQWDSTWELPSVPCAWILCTLVVRQLPVLVSYSCAHKDYQLDSDVYLHINHILTSCYITFFHSFSESMPHTVRTLHTNQKTHTQCAELFNSPAKWNFTFKTM